MKAQYFQAIEKTFLECTGRGLAISDADRTHIESWFEAGIPLPVVQTALVESISGRESKVRTISLARKRVEKNFTAWKSRQVGVDRTATSTFVDGFDEFVTKLEQLCEQNANQFVIDALCESVLRLKSCREETDTAEVLLHELQAEELRLYEQIWACLPPLVKTGIDSSVHDALSMGDLLDDDPEGLRFIQLRNKKLRKRLSLPPFEVRSTGA